MELFIEKLKIENNKSKYKNKNVQLVTLKTVQ